MKLKTIYFDAYKSILSEKLDVNHGCIGFVGTNESGKSNILAAISVLNDTKKLLAIDTPKMASSHDPCIRFQFTLTDKELKDVKDLVAEWVKANAIYDAVCTANIEITYTILFNKLIDIEERKFFINGIQKSKEDALFLLNKNANDQYKIKKGDSFIPINKAKIVRKLDIDATNKFFNIRIEIDEANNKIKLYNERLEELREQLKTITSRELERNLSLNVTEGQLKTSADAANAAQKNIEKSVERGIVSEVAKIEKTLENTLTNKNILEEKLKEFDLFLLIENIKNKILSDKGDVEELDTELKKIQDELNELAEKNERNDEDMTQEDIAKKKIIKFSAIKKIIQSKIVKDESELLMLEEPLEIKYTDNIDELNIYLVDVLSDYLKNNLPRVVFWEHNQNYILQSHTLFSNILEKTNLDEISRPLFNVFRIGLDIKTLNDLKNKIKEIQSKSNERSRIQETLNRKINKYIKSVWGDYDQQIKISLEQEQIRFEIYDPGNEDASYYNMDERSQGCKTFLSFLLTIGAEADHGVIKNTILLLDEPETHLHPSGVKFMLQELIKISERGNLVLYATHSIFLIDRNKFDRHIILEKKNERTKIKASSIGRIGYFMQEEVLYNTLDLNLKSDLSSDKKYNFVFEGDGDTVLFQHFYDKVLTKELKPIEIEKVSFYQGGKCSNIKKYFIERPIQLGTKWIFILDNDKPAEELKQFIENKYKEYVGTDIHVFQYGAKDSEFEDLLSAQFLHDVYLRAGVESNNSIDSKELKRMISSADLFNKAHDKVVKKYIDDEKRDDFKSSFKQVLNNMIKESAKNTLTADQFQKLFPKYYAWANNVVTQLKNNNQVKG